jgi:hypothetical protein
LQEFERNEARRAVDAHVMMMATATATTYQL